MILIKYTGYARMQGVIEDNQPDYELQFIVGRGERGFYENRWNAIPLLSLIQKKQTSYRFDNRKEYKLISDTIENEVNKSIEEFFLNPTGFIYLRNAINEKKKLLGSIYNGKKFPDSQDIEARNKFIIK